MVEENNVPREEEQPETFNDSIADDDLTADVISEADFNNETGSVENDPDPDEIVENPADLETEMLPEVPEELRDWYRGENAETDDKPAGDSEQAETENTVGEAAEVTESKEDSPAETDVSVTEDEPPAKISSPTPQAAPPPPAKLEWKVEAEKLFEEREAQKRQMLEKRREYEAAQRAKQEQHEAQLRQGKEQHDTQVKADHDAQENEKQGAVEDMMQRIREEKERKRLEREAVDEQLRQEREARSYKNQRDVDNRASRLSKPED